MKKLARIVSVLTALFVCIAVVGCSYAQPPAQPTKLDAPEVTINADGVATWEEVENAIYYVYVIDEGDEKLTDECCVRLAHNESVKVKAVSGSGLYADSEFSVYKTYIQKSDIGDDPDDNDKPVKLSIPQVSISSDGLATWDNVTNASSYVYVVNGGAEKNTTERSVKLSENDGIRVKALGDGISYADSDFSVVKTYVKSVAPPTRLAVPQVSVSSDGLATWDKIANASAYIYVINGGAERTTTERSVGLSDRDTIKVKAVSGSSAYSDSDYSQPQTYTSNVQQATKLATPVVSVDANGVAAWKAVANAQYYFYSINDGSDIKTTALSVALKNNQTIKVKAGSASDKYTDSDYSYPQKYVNNDAPDDHPLSAEVKAYYSKITAASGNSLLGQIHDLITKTHTYYTSYGECSQSKYVNVTDPGPNGGALEFYTQKSIMSFSGNIGDWNREHVWCKSLSNGMWKSVSNSTRNGGSDMHHIRPSECGLNSTRGSKKFGEVNGGTAAWSRNSSKNNVAIGGYYSGSTFEPLDNVKGDVARIVLYVYTHYNTYVNVYGTTNGNQSGVFGTLNFTHIMAANSESSAIQMLIKWSTDDPVDEIEITRNNEVYEIQGNRNPFIDHPEYVNAIWG